MERSEAVRRIREFGLYHAINDLPHSTFTVEAFNMAIEALAEEPRKHGRWDYNQSTDVYKCSECGSAWFWITNPQYKYCPECGARLESR